MQRGLVRAFKTTSSHRSGSIVPSINTLLLPPAIGQPLHLEQRRSNYQVVLQRQLDRKTGKVKYQDWDYLALSIQEPKLYNGQPLLDRHLRATEHIKPTERKRRINAKKILCSLKGLILRVLQECQSNICMN